MKKSKPVTVCALAIVLLAVLGAVGMRTFLSPCVHEDGTFATCHYAGEALFGLFLCMGVQALLALLLSGDGIRQGLLLALLCEAVYGLFLPGTLIRLCSMATMRCQSIMKPGARILLVLEAVLALVGALLCLKGKNDGHS